MERALLEAARAGRRPGAGASWRIGRWATTSGADWLVVERLEGETIPRKILRDAEWAAARARAHGPVRPRAGRHPHHRPGRDRAASRRPIRSATRCPSSTRSARCVRRSSSACAGWQRHRPAGGRARDGARRLPHGQPARRAGRAARRARLGAGPRRRPGRGHRLAVRAGLALRRPRRGGRLRRPGRAAGGVRGRRRRRHDARPRALVAGVRHGEVGGHLRAAGLGAPERGDPLGRAGRHRPARLRERVGPLRSCSGVAPADAAPEPAGRRPAGGRPSAGRRRPSWSRRCASTSTAGHGAQRGRAALRGAGGPQRAGHRRARAAAGSGHRGRPRRAGWPRPRAIADDAALAAAIRAGDFDDGWEPVAPALAAVGARPAAGGEPLLLAGGHARRRPTGVDRPAAARRAAPCRRRPSRSPGADALEQAARPAGCSPS